MRSVHVFAVFAALAVGGALAYVVVTGIAQRTPHSRSKSLESPRTAATEGGNEPRRVRPAPVVLVRTAPASPVGASSAVAAAPTDEAARMDFLRRSFTEEPLETLEAARDLEREFPESANAAERSWIAIRSLVNLGRFHEARDQARVLARRFPDSEWAVDAQRHLLVNPLDYPSREELEEQAASPASGDGQASAQ